jgi:lysophospholipase L1-like esterase/dienelactone hydrolase
MTSVVHAADSKRVLCFGDSITAGGQWVAEVGAQGSFETINAGKPGRKAAQAKTELAGYLNQYSNLDKIIMFLGVNDLPARDKRPGAVKVKACVTNMREAIDLALTRFKPEDIVLVAPCNVNPDRMSSVNLEKGYDVTPPLLAKLEIEYKALARKKGVLFCSLLNVVSKENFKDGLHPNEAGDAEIAGVLSRFLSANMDIVTKPAPKGWPKEIKELTYQASIDQSSQPMLMLAAKAGEKRPLLVALHTWSGTYAQADGEPAYARWCIENDWYFIHPDFRGPNLTPDACGSEKVVQDILDAVEYMKKHYNIDSDRIYLVGVSGGGYAALLMAGRAPELWAGVSAWASISDIRAWWEQKSAPASKYAANIEQAVGGRPDQNKSAARECVKRSPITYLDKAAGVNLDINAGVTDGHQGGSVPFTHSLYAFNQVVPEKDRIGSGFIEAFYSKQALPEGSPKANADPLYGTKQVVFRKVSGHTRVTLFQGGHEIIHQAALNWLAEQRKGRPTRWNVTAEHDLKIDEIESESGK